jgi:hypothetical protein
VLSFIVAPAIDPGDPNPLAVWAGFALFNAGLAVALFRHSKVAWVVALLIHTWGLIGGLPFLVSAITGEGDTLWLLWGLVLSGGSLAALLSSEMREWVGLDRKEASFGSNVDPAPSGPTQARR